MDNSRSISISALWQVLSIDFILLAFVYFIPTLSHLVGVPLYVLDPMRLVVLGSIVLVNDKRNPYILAITIPLFSYFVAGHPILYKNLIIAIELTANVYLFNYLIGRTKHVFGAAFGSIIASKALYYLLKYVLISFSVLNTSMVDTSIVIQIVVTLMISIVLSLTYKKLS